MSGAEAGKAYISCTAVTADVTLCHAAFVLAGGQIEAQVANGMATSFSAAITGGTGVYEGVTGPPLLRWTQPCACRFALYWLRAATKASPAASTTSLDDARTATLRPGSSTSSSTSPTAALPGPTE